MTLTNLKNTLAELVKPIVETEPFTTSVGFPPQAGGGLPDVFAVRVAWVSSVLADVQHLESYNSRMEHEFRITYHATGEDAEDKVLNAVYNVQQSLRTSTSFIPGARIALLDSSVESSPTNTYQVAQTWQLIEE